MVTVNNYSSRSSRGNIVSLVTRKYVTEGVDRRRPLMPRFMFTEG